MSYSKLIESALRAQKHAYALYSKFRVGAAIITDDGEIFSGCNVEASSYSLSICAERVAIFKAVSEGHRNFKALAVVTDAVDYCPPCGACLQVLWDIAKDIDVVLAKNTKDFKVKKLSQFFPYAFDDSYLYTNIQNTNGR